MSTNTYRIAIVKWADSDGIAEAIHHELIKLGHQTVYFRFDQPVPTEVDIVFSFAPYGRMIQIPYQLSKLPPEKRPLFLHWNTENYPDPRLPWFYVSTVARLRSWLDRLNDAEASWKRTLLKIPPFSRFKHGQRFTRFRLMGEYHYAYRKGWLDLFFESSALYAERHQRHGVPAIFIPWGTVADWHEDLNLERDIDVLWMGKRRTKRRSDMLNLIERELTAKGYHVYIADNEKNPFVYGDERTRMLNRAKITLNLESKWHDNALPYRFHIAAANRSLVASEKLLPHYYSVCQPGRHYVSAPPADLVKTLLYYLENTQEREEIVDNAYHLLTTELTIGKSIKKILQAIDHVKRAA